MATTKGIYTTNRTYVALLRGTYAYVQTYITDPFFRYTSLLLSGDTPSIPFNADASPNKFNIAVVADTKAANFSPYTSGYYSNFFDGTGDYLSLPSNAAFAFGTGAYTMEGWIYITAAPTYVSTMFEAGGATNGISLGVAASGAVNIGKYGIGTVISSSAGDVPSNQWVHVAAVRASTATNDTKIYVNGVLKATGTDNNDWTVITSPTVGGIAVAGYVTNGYISNLRVVKGVAVYTAAFTPSTAPLIAISGTSLLTCQENRFIDDSLNDFTITRNGDVSIKSFNPFLTPSAVAVNNFYSTNFDGDGDYLNAPSNAAFGFGTGDFTIEGWFYFTGTIGTYQRPWWFGDDNDNIEINSSVLRVGGASQSTLITGGTTILANTWYHIALVRANGIYRLWLNGTQQGSTATNSYNSSARTFTLMATSSGANPSTGNVSNFRIVKGTALYTGDFTPSTTPLSAITNTSLLTCQSPTLIDNSTNAFVLTSAGQAQPIPVSPFTQTTTSVSTTYLGSSYFDGTGDYLTVPHNALLTPSGDFTIEFWAYPTVTSLQEWYSKGDGIQIFTYNSTWNTALSSSNNTTYFLSGPFGSVQLNVWQHVALYRIGTAYYASVNGIVTSIGTSASAPNTGTSALLLGAYAGYDGAGYMSDVRFVNGNSVYPGSNFAPPIIPLTSVSNTQLLTLQNSQPHNNSTFLDSSSNKFLITRNGNSTQGAFTPYGGNWSVYAPATGSYLTTSNSIFNISSTTAVWTYESWVMPLTNNTFFCIGSGGSYGNSIYIGWNTNKFNVGAGSGAGSNPVTFETTNTYPAGLWYHVAVTRTSAGVYTLYINGVADGTQTYNAGGLAGGTTVVINGVADNNGLGNSGGSFYNSNMRFLVGTVLYTGNFTVPTAPLTAIANTALLTCADNRFIDDSPNNFTITKAGDIVPQRFSPFGPIITTPTTYSAYFDGNGDYLTWSGTTIGTGAMTFECWFYYTGSFSEIASFIGPGSAITGGLNCNLNNSTTFSFDRYGVSADNFTVPTITANTWNHVAFVRNSSNVATVFLNGVRSSTGTVSDTYSYTTSAAIGYTGGAVTRYFPGYMSSARLVVGSNVYNPTSTTLTVPTAPLTAIAGTSLLTCQSPTFIDNSTNAFAITAFGNSRPTTVNPFGFTNTASTYLTTTFSGSAYFDGTGDYLSVPASSAFAPGTGDFTVEGWFYATAAMPAYGGVIWGQTTPGTNYFIITAGNDANPVTANYISLLTTTSGGGTAVYSNSSNPFTLNTWNHFAVVRVSGTVTVYLNGIGGTATSRPIDLTNTTYTPYIGSPSGSSQYFPGYISNFRYVKGTALYKSNFVPPVAPVTEVANTSLLLNFTDAAVTDYSTMVNLESFGDVKITTANSRVGGSAMYFDGTGDYLKIPGTNQIVTFGTGDFTVEFWVYLNTVPTEFPPIITNDNGFYINFRGNGNIALTDISNQYAITASALTAGSWFHVAIVRNSGSSKVYVNGTGGTAVACTVNWAATTTAYIGGSPTYTTINGYIDDLRVTKYARYTSNFTPINSSHPLR